MKNYKNEFKKENNIPLNKFIPSSLTSKFSIASSREEERLKEKIQKENNITTRHNEPKKLLTMTETIL